MSNTHLFKELTVSFDARKNNEKHNCIVKENDS